MNFEIFDEEYYLKSYPFLKPAIEQNIIQSGLDHFQRFGLALGFTEVSRYYDEAFYLANNAGITEAVNAGILSSGLDHFIQFGYEEGRTLISSDYNEQFYQLANRDLSLSMQDGTFRNGLEHFIKFGADEGRYSNSFFEAEYLANNPGVAAAVEAGTFRTGRDHYEQFGQFEPLRSATFMGTVLSDRVEAFGVGNVEITGVVVVLESNGNRNYRSNGFNLPGLEIKADDILVGTPGSDTFVLGVGRGLTGSSSRDFYFSDTGIVNIQNFNPDQDTIQLGRTQADYSFQDDGLNLIISNRNQIPLGVIEGGSGMTNLNVIYSGEIPLERNFLEDEYLSQNPDVAADVDAGLYTSGLDHYEQVGQFDPNRSATFVGTPVSDTITAFGVGSHDIIGVEVLSSGTFRSYTSTGVDEFDTLIGSPGAADNFILGSFRLVGKVGSFAVLEIFYSGNGNATLVNFNPAEGDSIYMVGSPERYSIFSSGSDLVIAEEGDILAVIAGGADLTLTPNVTDRATFKTFTLT